ncbi:MAG: cytochrome c oxidase subunit II [Anaerolineae bacterium]
MHVDRYERIYIVAFVALLGVWLAALMVGAVVFGVRVPSSTAFVNPSELDQTEFANPGLRDMGNNEYEVYMVARMWSFTPAEIRVPEGAHVTFNVTSADITHGFIIEHHNANIEVIPGHIGQTSVTFDEPGTFAIQCHEYCGRGHHLMHMNVIVEETETVSN